MKCRQWGEETLTVSLLATIRDEIDLWFVEREQCPLSRFEIQSMEDDQGEIMSLEHQLSAVHADASLDDVRVVLGLTAGGSFLRCIPFGTIVKIVLNRC